MNYIRNDITSASELAREFEEYGRGDQFSRYAFDALFEYYSEFYCDNPYEPAKPFTVDVIGICCDWCEYSSLHTFKFSMFAFFVLRLASDHASLKI